MSEFNHIQSDRRPARRQTLASGVFAMDQSDWQSVRLKREFHQRQNMTWSPQIA